MISASELWIGCSVDFGFGCCDDDDDDVGPDDIIGSIVLFGESGCVVLFGLRLADGSETGSIVLFMCLLGGGLDKASSAVDLDGGGC